MARKLIVEVIADTSKYLASMKASSTATKQFAVGVDKVAVSTEVAAKAQVAAAVKTTESLKLQVAEYKRLAAAAEVGSREQIAAANLASQAERKLAASMGVAAHEAANLQRHSGLLGRDVSKASRGALAGSGIFHTFGRSLAFASGGFLAFEGVTKFLTDSINAAREAGVAQRSLAAQMKASGESFKANRAQIEQVAVSYGKFGFQNDEVIQSLTVLERGTGNLNTAIRLQGLTADLARAKNLGLSQAATVVAKVFGGQETALRRAVPGLNANAHGYDLLQQAQKKLAGQAAANTTAAERFRSTLHDTEEIIGTALLPTLNRLLDRFSAWLQRMNESGALQQRVSKAAHVLSGAFRTLSGWISTITEDLGGWKNALTVLAGAWIGFKVTAIASTVAVTTANLVAAGVVERAWQAALIATGWGAVAVAAGIAATEIITHWEAVKRWFEGFWLWLQEGFDRALLAVVEPFSHLPFGLGGWAQDLKKQLSQDITDLQGMFTQLQQTAGKGLAAKAPGGPGAAAIPGLGGLKGRIPGAGGTAAAAAAKGFTLPFRFQLEQARAEATGVQAQIVKAAHDIAVFIAGIIPKLKGKKLLDAYQQFAQANGVVRDAVLQATEKAKEAAANAKQMAQAVAAAAKQFAVPLVLQVAQARAEALGKSLRPILIKIKQAAERALKSGRLGLQGQLDAWNTIAAINQQLADHATKTTRAAAAAFKPGTWGMGAQTTITPSAALPASPGQFVGAGARPAYQINNLNLYGIQDVRGLEDELAKRSLARPQARRGG